MLPPADRVVSVESKSAPAKDGETRPYRHPQHAEGPLMASYDEDVKTLYEGFLQAVEKFGIFDRSCGFLLTHAFT